jgi:para-nitrobenzyl esterase
MKKLFGATTINRRTLLAAASMTAGLVLLPSRRAPAFDSFEQGPMVDTADGKVRGLVDRTISVFRGIPYGAPTGGENRFLPPKKPRPWTHVREAFAFGNSAPQTNPDGKPWWSAYVATEGANKVLQGGDPDGVRESEDCLYLNVCTPSLDRTAKKPVMVWLHGGGMFSGSASWNTYQGENLARARDVVVVGINHRLNVFGFAYFGKLLGPEYASSGNVGMLDIVQALQWLRQNIAGFGGDPDNVTLFGDNGGASKLAMLMAMPSAEGLFHRGIMESCPFGKAGTIEEANHAAEVFLSELSLKPTQLSELQQLPTQQLYRAYSATMAKLGLTTPSGDTQNFAPIVDGVVLPRHPFYLDAPPDAARIPLIIGFNHSGPPMGHSKRLHDMDEDTLRQRVLEMPGATPKNTDRRLAASKNRYPKASAWQRYLLITGGWALESIRIADLKAAQNGAPVYFYRFDYQPTKDGNAVPMILSAELPFVFNNVKASNSADDTPQTQALAAQMSGAWATFARTGNPNIAVLPNWPAYDTKNRPTMIFDFTSNVEQDPEREVRIVSSRYGH